MRNRTLNLQITAIFAIIIVSFVGCALFFTYLNTNSLKVAAETETDLSAIMFTSSIRDNIPVTEIEYHVSGSGEVETREALPDELENTLDEVLSSARDELGEDLDVWVVNKAGKIYFSSVDSESRNTADASGADSAASGVASGTDTEPADAASGADSAASGDASGTDTEPADAESGTDPDMADSAANTVADTDGEDSSGTDSAAAAEYEYILGEEFLTKAFREAGGESGLSLNWIGKDNRLFMNQSLCAVRTIYKDRLYLVMLNRCSASKALQRSQIVLFAGMELALMFVMVVLIANTLFSYRRKIIKLATVDELTGLSNRKYFNAAYREYAEQERGRAYSLFLVDIDYFKQINDTYGHATGDLALRSLAGHIRDMVIDCGGFAGRWGGDEFIGVLPLEGAEAEAVLDAFCERIRNDVLTVDAGADSDTFNITVSVGTAAADGAEDLSHLSEKADKALYASKKDGRDRVTLYYPELEDLNPESATSSSSSSSQDARYGWRTAGKAAQYASDAGAAHLAENEGASAESESAAGNAAAVAAAAPETGLQSGILDESSFGRRLLSYIKNNLLESTVYGVRWMAPFVAGGGILIGLAFLFDAASIDMASLSVEARSQFGSITETAAVLKSIGDTTFNFMLPVFAGFMAYGIAGESAFMAGFVGGYMTIGSQSGFIGAMVAGFVAGVMALELHKFLKHFPVLIRKAAPIIIYPVFNLIIMEALSLLVITPISSAVGGLFTTALDAAAAKGSVAAGTLASAMMSIDMGGIINKVAYNYGVAGLEDGGTGLMACVMAGGMVPPLGIALSILLYRRSFSADERDRGPGTLFMGLCFITEGALPYVFQDIKRVIPSCIAGSALAGCLSAIFGCELPAPHGGIFVLPVMEQPVFYLVALAAGSALTAVILGNWKLRAYRRRQKK